MTSVKVLLKFHNLLGLMFEKLLNIIIIFNIYGNYNGVTNVSDFTNNSALPPSFHPKPLLPAINDNDSNDEYYREEGDCFSDEKFDEI